MFSPTLWRFRKFSDAIPEIFELQREMNRLFSNAGRRSPTDYPAVNIWEKDGAALVTAEVPGIDPEKMDVSVSGDVLTIAGVPAANEFKKGETYLRQERMIGGFKRSIQLPFSVDAQNVEARYDKGVLTVTLPRLKEELPKKIQIK